MNQTEASCMKRRPRVMMVGPNLLATSGISAVVNNWLDAGLEEEVDFHYLSTLTDYVPGHYLQKTIDALRAYYQFITDARKYDIVHIHVSSGMGFYRKLVILLIAGLKNTKVAVHLHGSVFREFYDNSSGIQKLLIRYFFDRADAIFVLSESWLNFIREISKNDNIYIIYNGASVDRLCKVERNDGKIVISFMGRLGDRKGTYDLLDAFEKLIQSEPAAFLILGGDGDVEKVRSLVKEKNLDDNIDILGWVPGDRKYEVFNRSDIYTLPSYNEGLPGSILEGMAAGLPIISTPVGGIPEAVIEGHNGYLIEPGDSDALCERMLRLCQDSELRKKMGEESRRIIIEKFDISKIVNNLVCVYQKMLSS